MLYLKFTGSQQNSCLAHNIEVRPAARDHLHNNHYLHRHSIEKLVAPKKKPVFS